MNPEFSNTERAQVEAKLTALLLGELQADEVAVLSKAMEADPELAALYERLKVTIELVREMKPAAEEPAALKLSAEKREKLLASFKTVAPKEFAKPRRVMDWLVPWAACVAIVGVIAVLLLPNFARSKSKSRRAYAGRLYSAEANVVRNQAASIPVSGGGDAAPVAAPTPVMTLRAATTQQNNFAIAPAATPPAAIPPMTIVLPSEQDGDTGVKPGQVVAGLNLNVTHLDNADPTVVRRTLKRFAGEQTNALADNSWGIDVPKDAQPQMSGFGDENIGKGTLTPGSVVVTNGIVGSEVTQQGKWDWTIDTQNKLGTLTLADGSVAQVSAEGLRKAMAEATNSSAFVGRDAYVDKPVANDGLLTAGLRTPARAGEVVQGENRTGAEQSIRPASGGKQIELAAAGSSGNTVATNGRGLRYVTGLEPATETQSAVRDYLRSAGVNLGSSGKSVFFNDRQGTVTVRGTDEDLAKAEAAIEALNTPAPTVTAKTKFAEVNQNDSRQLGFDWYLGNYQTNNGAVTASGGSMPASQAAHSGSNWWSTRATVRGFSDDSANSKPGPSNVYGLGAVGHLTALSGRGSTNVVMLANNNAKAYDAANEELERAKKLREVISLKTGQEQVESLPRAQMVTIMNPATPAATEKPGLGQKIKETLTGKVERTASVQVEQERPDINRNGVPDNGGNGYDPDFLKTESEIIQSDAVLGKVVEKLKLDGGDKSKTKAAEERLKKNLDLRPVQNTKLLEITARSEKPEDAARIANAVAEVYREYSSLEYENMKHGGVYSLQQQLQEQDQKIALAQARVDELRKSLEVPDVVANANSASELMTANRLNELLSLKVQKEAEYNQQKTLLENLKAMDKGDLRKSLPIAVTDAQLNELLSEYDLAQQALIKLKIDYAPDHPKYKSAQGLVNDLDRKIDERVQGDMLGLDAKVVDAKSYVDALTKELANAEQAQSNALTASARVNDTALPKPAVPPPTPQPEILTRENAFSTFSLNVSDVSFKLAAATLEKGQMPEPGSIRSEEFINAFDYRDPDAAPGVPIAFASERARYPFAHNRELLRFSLKTAAAGRQAGRPLNIVLLLDNSGSMERADRVGIIREALRVLAGQLQAGDTFSIVTFARTAQLRVDGIPGNQAAAAADEISKLTPEGGTNLGEALDLAYATARHHYLANGDNRVVLLTDGAANLGDVNADTLKQKVEAQRQQGIALDCFGIGWEGYNDDLLEVLTRNGDGRYGFINSPAEASTEFVAQIAGALHVAASDVKVQVEFNPQRVTAYRQIGYAKHQLTKEQFRDNTVDAAEIAAQEAGNALYTIEINPEGSGSIATVRVRYKVPGTAEYREQAWDVPYTGGAVAMDQASPAMRLASTACAFSEWLATSPFAAEVNTDELLRYMNGVPQFYGADGRPAKLEWMIRQAKSVSGK